MKRISLMISKREEKRAIFVTKVLRTRKKKKIIKANVNNSISQFFNGKRKKNIIN